MREDRLGVVAGRIGEDDLAPGQPAQRVDDRPLEDDHALEVGEAVRLAQEVIGVGAVVADEPEQGRAVAYPVLLPDARRFFLVEAEMALDVFAHRAVDVGKDVRRGVVEGVVEIEQPGAMHVCCLRPLTAFA